jgi:hypothetical protein
MRTLNLLLENLDPLAQLLLQAFFRTLWQGILIVALVWLLGRLQGRGADRRDGGVDRVRSRASCARPAGRFSDNPRRDAR